MAIGTRFVVGVLVFAGAISLYAQNPSSTPAPQHGSGVASTMKDSTSIFCGTMHTGQLCSMGTTNILKVTPEQQQAWLAAAHKYNRAVEAARQQLLQDAAGTLRPEQMTLLKAWFDKGINPQINKLLFAQGLGELPPPAQKEK